MSKKTTAKLMSLNCATGDANSVIQGEVKSLDYLGPGTASATVHTDTQSQMKAMENGIPDFTVIDNKYFRPNAQTR